MDASKASPVVASPTVFRSHDDDAENREAPFDARKHSASGLRNAALDKDTATRAAKVELDVLTEVRVHEDALAYDIGSAAVSDNVSGKKSRTSVESDVHELARPLHFVDTDRANADEDSTLPQYAPLLRTVRQALRVRRWFPLQRRTLKCLLDLERRCATGDVLISAPTGSGKTLAFVLPLVDALRGRRVARLRALVLAPSRELAAQLFTVVHPLCEAASLRAALSVGGVKGSRARPASLRKEGEDLVSRPPDVLVATPGRLVDHIQHTPGFSLAHVRTLVLDESDRLLRAGFHDWATWVTPVAGRRVAGKVERDAVTGEVREIRVGGGGAPCATLARRVLASATQTRNPKYAAQLSLRAVRRFVGGGALETADDAAVTGSGSGGAGDAAGVRFVVPHTLRESAMVCEERVTKLHVLVTLLQLYPSRLAESDSEKPTALSAREAVLWRAAHTIDNAGASRAKMEEQDKEEAGIPPSPPTTTLVFTRSLRSAHRLARLLELVIVAASQEDPSTDIDVRVNEFSSSLSMPRRAEVLKQVAAPASLSASGASPARRPRSRMVVVCSDSLARGIDVEGGVSAVVNFDVPAHITTYLHRVGRTARAGRPGGSVTLLLRQQARHFKALMAKVYRGEKSRVRVDDLRPRREHVDSAGAAPPPAPRAELEMYIERSVRIALGALSRVLRLEELGIVQEDAPLLADSVRQLCAEARAEDDAPARSRSARRGSAAGELDVDDPMGEEDDKEEGGVSTHGVGAAGVGPATAAGRRHNDEDDGGGSGQDDDNGRDDADEELSLRQLLRAQIASNFMSQAAKGDSHRRKKGRKRQRDE